jgi:hypothetical protein
LYRLVVQTERETQRDYSQTKCHTPVISGITCHRVPPLYTSTSSSSALLCTLKSSSKVEAVQIHHNSGEAAKYSQDVTTTLCRSADSFRLIQLALTRTDIAVNLTDPMYRGEYHGKTRHASDLDQVVERAKKAGVERILITGTSLQETKDALALAKK